MQQHVEIVKADTPQYGLGHHAQDLCYQEFNWPLQWDDGYGVYVALADYVVVGASNVFIDPKERFAYIQQLAVDARHRSQGIGSALIRHAIQLAGDAGCASISVQPQTGRNVDLYERFQFAFDRSRDPYKMFLDISQPSL